MVKIWRRCWVAITWKWSSLSFIQYYKHLLLGAQLETINSQAGKKKKKKRRRKKEKVFICLFKPKKHLLLAFNILHAQGHTERSRGPKSSYSGHPVPHHIKYINMHQQLILNITFFFRLQKAIIFLKLFYFEVSFSNFVTYNFYFQILTFHWLFKCFTPLLSSELKSPWFVPCSLFFCKYIRSSELPQSQGTGLLQIPHRPTTSAEPHCSLEFPKPIQTGFWFEARFPNLLENQISGEGTELNERFPSEYQFENHSNMTTGLYTFLKVESSCVIIGWPLQWIFAHRLWLYWNGACFRFWGRELSGSATWHLRRWGL